MTMLTWFLQTGVLWLGLYVFLHDFENPKRPYLTLRYILTWLYYLLYLVLVVLLGMGYSIPLRLVLSGQVLSAQEAPLFYLATGAVLACLVMLGVLTRILVRRRAYYHSVREKRR